MKLVHLALVTTLGGTSKNPGILTGPRGILRYTHPKLSYDEVIWTLKVPKGKRVKIIGSNVDIDEGAEIKIVFFNDDTADSKFEKGEFYGRNYNSKTFSMISKSSLTSMNIEFRGGPSGDNFEVKYEISKIHLTIIL